MSQGYDGIERVVSGSFIRVEKTIDEFGIQVHQTPREVREVMQSSSDDLIELSHYGRPDVPVYVDRRYIIAVTPMWNKVET